MAAQTGRTRGIERIAWSIGKRGGKTAKLWHEIVAHGAAAPQGTGACGTDTLVTPSRRPAEYSGADRVRRLEIEDPLPC